MEKFSKKRKGFTLAEILIVVALLGILMTVLLVSVGSYFDKTRETGVRNDFNNMKTAVEVVMRENSGLPKKTGASSGVAVSDAVDGFNKTVNLINDYLDPNMKWVDGNDEDHNGYVVTKAIEGYPASYTELTVTDSGSTKVLGDTGMFKNTDITGAAVTQSKYIVSNKTDPWKYNYSVYFQRMNDPNTVGRLDKVLITSWGKDGNEKEAQFGMLIEYDNGVITIAQAGFQGENLNTLKVGVIDDATGKYKTEDDMTATITRDNAVGKGHSATNAKYTAAFTADSTSNLIYGSIIDPDGVIATDINNFGNANLTQFDAEAYNS